MCDGKHSSKREVVILSIKPKRPEYPSSQKAVPVCELLQEWDKLDAYYRGQLLKLTKSISKSNATKPSKHSRHSISRNSPNIKVNSLNKTSSPVNKKHSSSLSSDQFTELFGDENLFNDEVTPPDANNNGNSRHYHNHKHNKLLHSKSLNSLFDDDSLEDGAPPPHDSHSRKNSLSNLVVSIPVLSVQRNGDTFLSRKCRGVVSADEDSASEVDEDENFLSVPRDNFRVQYGTKQKTRVTLVEKGNTSPKWIVPVHVAPYKPPAAQGLNGVQIQKILYHKNDSVNYASPTTTTARTPDKPPDNNNSPPTSAPPSSKSVKVNSNSPVSTVSPRSLSGSSSATSSSSPIENNNATPKQVSSPELSPPKSEKSPVSNAKLSSPPINSTTGTKLKRPITASTTTMEAYSNGHSRGKKSRHGTGTDISNSTTYNSPPGFNTLPPVTSTSSTYSFSSSSSSSCGDNEYQTEDDLSPRANSIEQTKPDPAISPKKLNIIKKTSVFLKPAPASSHSSSSTASTAAPVFIPPAAVSITERIIKKASRPHPELIERQRRRRQESNQRKSYAMQKGDEHEERESIDLSMKSFEMIWNVPLLSPLRSP